MKILSRKELLKRYRSKYTSIIEDPEERLKLYFRDNGLDYEKAREKAEKLLIKVVEDVEYRVIRMTLYEYPMKTERPRRRFGGGTYSPNAKDNLDYMEAGCKSLAKSIKLINTPAKIEVRAYLEMPTGVKPEEIFLYEAAILNPLTTPDYDNIGKCYTDMLKNVLILDDDVFYKGTVTKFYSVLPRVEIEITYQTQHNSDYVFKKLKTRKSIKEGIKNNTIVLERYQ